MKKRVISILMAIAVIASVSTFTGCNEKPETSVGASGKNLTDEISKINEDESTSITEAVTEVITETVDVSDEKIEIVKNAYLPKCSRMCKEADNICTNTEWKYYESEDYVEFLGSRSSDTEGMQGTINISATRTTNGTSYPLTIKMTWTGTDYGDYITFSYGNADING